MNGAERKKAAQKARKKLVKEMDEYQERSESRCASRVSSRPGSRSGSITRMNRSIVVDSELNAKRAGADFSMDELARKLSGRKKISSLISKFNFRRRFANRRQSQPRRFSDWLDDQRIAPRAYQHRRGLRRWKSFAARFSRVDSPTRLASNFASCQSGKQNRDQASAKRKRPDFAKTGRHRPVFAASFDAGAARQRTRNAENKRSRRHQRGNRNYPKRVANGRQL